MKLLNKCYTNDRTVAYLLYKYEDGSFHAYKTKYFFKDKTLRCRKISIGKYIKEIDENALCKKVYPYIDKVKSFVLIEEI